MYIVAIGSRKLVSTYVYLLMRRYVYFIYLVKSDSSKYSQMKILIDRHIKDKIHCSIYYFQIDNTRLIKKGS